ncbi:MAG: tRNA glutamyl-Q(34) synthetase GluQRS [Gammaproteobacteria bacterium]|nr:tRNA glutamyl-Q(34) synthetase GluQRS [Gammaproteobacteria bacterium]MDP7418389.1 tRNA glutamyl-Q(34) synthetase GluQRS [Gammaproteobacteria bacterium]HJP39989.1 tRNA glutamyl-Q(34) synthetase GluQRS [Gammaproteobacteria bacterium]
MESDFALPGYRGRFAPSPTGPLHFGSLVTATASYLQALTNRGEWLLRIEDLDPPREVPGATERIIDALEAHAFRWDGPVRRQSSHLDEYQEVAERLLAEGLAYRCTCSREGIRSSAKIFGPTGPVYSGTCRDLNHIATDQKPDALRLRTDDSLIRFEDTLQGPVQCHIAQSIGDFIIRRKDGLIAYNLAVVIDDARQGITEVVRGYDLLAITPAQIKLQQVIGLPSPIYMHMPVVTNEHGQKLSKQTGALPIDVQTPGNNLLAALKFLNQRPPSELGGESTDTIWAWAAEHWHPEMLL